MQGKSKTPLLTTPVRQSPTLIPRNTEEAETETELPLSPEIKSIIRRKVSSYLNGHITLTPPPSKQINLPKKSRPLPKEFPQYENLIDLLRDQKATFHLFKQKIDRGLDQLLYFFLKVLSLAIQYECKISQKEINEQSSVMIEAFRFISWSLLQAGAEKAGYYFATIAVIFCQYYKLLHPIGQFLLILAKINRKLFRYRQSIILLKKALQYNWWTDTTRAEIVGNQFKKWLNVNYPEEVENYDHCEVIQVFSKQNGSFSQRTYSKVEGQLQTLNDLLYQHFTALKIQHQGVKYEIVHKRQHITDRRTADLQLQIYNQLSFNFLQLNKKQQSRIFAEKYESGYTQPEDSKIILLSHQLITSIQKQVAGWHQITPKNFQLLFFADLFAVVSGLRGKTRNLDQQMILNIFKVVFEGLCDNFAGKEMFSYEIPLPLELRRDIPKTKRRGDGKKFIIRQRSNSQAAKQPVSIIKKYSSDKVQENLIFNYRGLRVSRLKLLEIYSRFIDRVAEVDRQYSLSHFF